MRPLQLCFGVLLAVACGSQSGAKSAGGGLGSISGDGGYSGASSGSGATGLSNGGYLSYRLACEASDLFVAVAPSAGAIGTAAIGGGTGSTSDLTTCAPTHKVSVLDIHGTSDPLIAYSTQKPSLAIVQASNGCSMTNMPATVVPSGGDTTCVSFAGCPTCPNVNVTGCSIMGGGHCWFGSSDCGTGGGAIGTAVVGNNSNFMKNTDSIWAFFSAISR